MKTKLRNLVITTLLNGGVLLASSGEPISHTIGAVHDHPVCVIGGAVGMVAWLAALWVRESAVSLKRNRRAKEKVRKKIRKIR